MTDAYDLIAIGAGPAGESAAELASFFGHRSAIIEKNRPGGVVTTSGGAPTKTLRETALYLSGLREGDVYGLRMSTAPDVAIDDTDGVPHRARHVRSQRLRQCGHVEPSGVVFGEDAVRCKHPKQTTKCRAGQFSCRR